MKVGLPVGLTTTFWFLMGLLRALQEKFSLGKPLPKLSPKERVTVKDIAVMIPAHNEEAVIAKCLRALKKSVKGDQIYVASDGSTDNTLMEVKKEGCRVVGIAPGIGKAKALVYLLEYYRLFEKYKLIMILDADTKVDPTYIPRALKAFNDPDIIVVFPSSRIRWKHHLIPSLKYYFISYRERLNRILQYFLMYGQTWKYTNASFVVPGYCTIYRSTALKQLRIDTPGLLIEDFNLAFQIHKKKLGKIHFQHNYIAWDQHPDNLRDYWKQVRRWNIGYFQTIVANGFWPSFFWFSMMAFTLEVGIHAIFLLFVPFVILFKLLLFLPQSLPIAQEYTAFVAIYMPYLNYSFFDFFLAFWWFDYMMTIIFGIMGRKPEFLYYGVFFFIMHWITALILLTSFIPGFFSKSDGRWNSPKRHHLVG